MVQMKISFNMMRISQLNFFYSSFCAYLAAFSFGIMIGYTSPSLPDMERQRILDKNQGSWFGSLATIGAMVGSFLGGWLVQYIGRRKTLIGTAVPFILGWFLIWWNGGISDLFAGRFFTGVASGMTVVSGPMYISETCTKDLRGMMGSGVQLSITIGILFVYVLGLVFHWYTIAAVAGVIPVVAVLLSLRIPETPRYLVLQNRKAEAYSALMWLRGTSSSNVEDELRDIEDSLGPDVKVAWSEFLEPQLKKPLIVAVGLMILQQVSGINVVMFYTVSLFESAGFTSGEKITVGIGLCQVIFTFASCLLMDRAGRRFLLFLSGAMMAVTCFGFGIYFHFQITQNINVTWLAVASMLFYIVGFSLGWGPIPMLIMSEIFPVKARGAATGITTVAVWVAAFIVTKEFSVMQQAIGSNSVFYLFGICCLLGIIFVHKLVPETKGKSLEDIEMYFLNKSPRII